MNKCHVPITWINDQTPAINDTHLNQYDGELDTLDDRIITLDGTKALQSDLLLAFKDVSLDATTGIITFTLFNNTTKTIDTLLEKIAINFDYDDDPTSPHYQNLIIELEDGTYKYIDMSALITEYEFDTSSTVAFTVANDGTVTADVIDGSITSSKLDPALATPIVNAEANGLKSEGFAVGEQNGVPVTSGSPYYQNNAKYYKEQAAAIAQQSLGGLSDVTITSVQDGQALIYDANSGEWENSNLPTPTTSLSALTDTTITTPTDKQILTYDNANSKWINADAPVSAPNPNSLHNPWFTVNQRGFTSGTAGTPTTTRIDRWKASYAGGTDANGVFTYNNSKITIAPYVANGRAGRVYWTQVFEDDAFAALSGKTMTLSVLLDSGEIKTFTFTENGNTQTSENWEVNNAPTYLAISFVPTYKCVQLLVSTSTDGTAQSPSVTIKAVKLELGSVSTLALDAPPDYTTELLKCRRYFRRYNIKNTSRFKEGWVHSTSLFMLMLNFDVPMYTGTTMTLSTSGTFNVELPGSSAVTITSIDLNDAAAEYVNLRCYGTFSSGKIGELGILLTSSIAYIDISAEL